MARADKTVINKGDEINVEVYITGYGVINGGKLVFFPSTNLFVNTKSYVSFNIKEDPETRIFTFGNLKVPLNDSGNNIDLHGGLQNPKCWEDPTLFFDTGPLDNSKMTPQIMTETNPMSNPPFHYHFLTKKSLSPSNYTLDFVLTYHNGTEWKSSNASIQFTVRNILQQYEIPIAIIVLVATACSIAALVFQILDFNK